MPVTEQLIEQVPENYVVIQVVSILSVSVFLLFISRLIVKGKLREEYAIAWFLLGIILLVFSIWRNGLELLADVLGVDYAPSILFMFGILVLIAFLVQLSVANSRHREQIRELSQEIGLMKKRMESDQKDD